MTNLFTAKLAGLSDSMVESVRNLRQHGVLVCWTYSTKKSAGQPQSWTYPGCPKAASAGGYQVPEWCIGRPTIIGLLRREIVCVSRYETKDGHNIPVEVKLIEGAID